MAIVLLATSDDGGEETPVYVPWFGTAEPVGIVDYAVVYPTFIPDFGFTYVTLGGAGMYYKPSLGMAFWTNETDAFFEAGIQIEFGGFLIPAPRYQVASLWFYPRPPVTMQVELYGHY